jgi:hypothetical protein
MRTSSDATSLVTGYEAVVLAYRAVIVQSEERAPDGLVKQ